MNRIRLTALLILVSLVLTACSIQDVPVIGRLFGGGEGVDTSKPVTLTVWGLWESPEVIQALINKYQELKPNVTINYDDRSILKIDDYKDRIFSSAGQTIDADVVMVHNSWVPRLKETLVPIPATLMDAGTFSTNFYPVAVKSAVHDNQVYAMPLYYDGLALVYNKQHFDEVGQSEPPTAWEEFRSLALRLTVRAGADNTSNNLRSGAAIGTADNIDFFSDILGLMWSQAGVEIPTDLGTRAAQDALTFYTNFVKEDKVWDPTMPEATTAFADGKVSMIFAPTWIVNTIVEARPDLDVGVAPVPQAVPDRPASWASFWMVAVPNTSQNSAVAWDFINFLGQEDQQLLRFNESSNFRTIVTPYNSQTLNADLTSNPYLRAYVTTAPFASGGVMSARSGNKLQIDLLREAVNAVLKGDTSEQALKKMLNQ
ncbi:hypothetical protein A3F07_02480 [candidate division WWE3 bacterium RIFCSPHIGHO2_12_FULL_38_15]|uniref:ABC transporter substrate-binding protein n=1 Tax=candidate division WWE3 bacterium RIFCSPHIGHO2_02_FULL_38_14 TaxID=1802620 RepID=A0A1F4V666_UNCKA|nr:MAG: hypothetical protein A3F07_02480 [candidate division WWE3 bacterium RIFCSPHIGHO2_12_FULL_38_15]OGC52677.1 MAG: hypothetical protein A3D91_03330 [candidate division WWE3 bacterium RIFCSPHIGHO2_02_FULL_38_14]